MEELDQSLVALTLSFLIRLCDMITLSDLTQSLLNNEQLSQDVFTKS